MAASSPAAASACWATTATGRGMIWGGALGTVKEVYVDCGGPSGDCYLPAEKLPAGMTAADWDMWLGPAP